MQRDHPIRIAHGSHWTVSSLQWRYRARIIHEIEERSPGIGEAHMGARIGGYDAQPDQRWSPHNTWVAALCAHQMGSVKFLGVGLTVKHRVIQSILYRGRQNR
jgi:hypothetical protein